jgi:hypothetical protein
MKETGFFVMEDAVNVLKQPNLEAAKTYLESRITIFVQKHPAAKKENILKANKMIERATSLDKLSISVANFILAHTSENLAVI